MRDGFVALTTRRDENRIAADDGLLGRFSGTRPKSPLPKNGLGILKITLDEQLNLLVGGSKVDDGHLAAQAVKGVIAGGNDAAGGVEDEFALGIRFQAGENFIKNGNFLS